MNWNAFLRSPWLGTGLLVILAATAQAWMVRRETTSLLESQGIFLHRFLKNSLENRHSNDKLLAQAMTSDTVRALTPGSVANFLQLVLSENEADVLDQAREKKDLFKTDLLALGTVKSGGVLAQSPDPKAGGESWSSFRKILNDPHFKDYSGIQIRNDKAHHISAFAMKDIFLIIGHTLDSDALKRMKEISGGEVFLVRDGKIMESSSQSLPSADLEKDLKTYFKFDVTAAEKSDSPTAIIPYSLGGKSCYVQLGAIPTPDKTERVLYGLVIPATEAAARLDALSMKTSVIGWIAGGLLILLAFVTSRNEKIITQTVMVTQDGKTISTTQNR